MVALPVEPGQLVGQPVGNRPPQVAVGDPRRVPAGRELARVVGDGHQPEPAAPGLDDRAAARLGLAAARPGDGDPGLAEQLERLDQRLGLVVERVVVGQAGGPNADRLRAIARPGAARGRRTACRRTRSVGSPRAEMQHSRLQITRSQERHSSRTSGAHTSSGGTSASRSATARPSITSPSSAIVGVTRPGYPPCTASPPCSSSVLPIGGIGLSRMIRAMCRRLCAHQELVRCVYGWSGPPASR